MTVVKTISLIVDPRERRGIAAALLSRVEKNRLPSGGLAALRKFSRLCEKVRTGFVDGLPSSMLVDPDEMRAIVDALQDSRLDAPGELNTAEVDAMCGMLAGAARWTN